MASTKPRRLLGVLEVSEIRLDGSLMSIRVVSDCDGLILRNSGIGSERDVEPGDLLCGVIGIGLVGQVEVEVSGIHGLTIDGDREGVFDVIDLSLCLCELLREGDGERGTSGIDSSGAAEGWRVGIDGGVIGDLLREGVRGVAGQIGDTNGVIGCDIGVGEQEALSFLEGVGVAEADQESAVGGISGIELCEVLAEGGSTLLSIDKEFEISISKGGATRFPR